MVLDTFLPYIWAALEKLDALCSYLRFPSFAFGTVLRLSKHRHPLEAPQVTGATPRVTVSQSWGLIICISNKSSGAGAADLAFSE